MRIQLSVNGEKHEADVEPRLLLVHLLRENLRLTGTHIGCDTTHCGACTVLLHEALLDGIELAALLQALHRRHLPAVRLHRQHRARLHGHAVQQHRAGAAVGGIAADVRAGEPQVLADEVHQQQARLDLGLARGAVHLHADLVGGHHLPPARWAALRRARMVSTRAISFL